MKKNKILGFAAPLLSVATILCIWWAAAAVTDNEYVLPTIGETFKRFISLFTYSEFYAALGSTFLRSAIAFAMSFALSFSLAVAAHRSRFAARAFSPVIALLRALPTVAVVLLLLVWTNSQVAPVIVTMLVVLPTLFTNLKNALDGMDGELLEMCKVYAVPKKKVFFKVKLPAIMPYALRSAGAGLSLNIKLMVAAEVLSQTDISMGFFLNASKVYSDTVTMLGLVLASILTGLVAEGVFVLFARVYERKFKREKGAKNDKAL